PLRGTADVVWLKPDGTEMTEADWTEGHETCVGMFLNGQAITSPGPRGENIVDDSFLLLINASPEPRKWSVGHQWGRVWHYVLDTADGPPAESDDDVQGDLVLIDRSVVLLRRIDG